MGHWRMTPAAHQPGAHAGAGVGVLDLVEAIPRFAEQVVLPTVSETQRAFVNRAYGVAGVVVPSAAVVHRLHETVAGEVYGAIRLGLRGCSLAVRGVRAGLAGRADPQLRGRRAHVAWTALNGVAGDHLSVHAPRLAIAMTVRAGGTDIDIDTPGLTSAFPQPSRRIAVFIHGLLDSERRWSEGSESACTDAVRAIGWTPVPVRLNTGLPLRENGTALARLLEDLVEAWPVAPERIALIGHSMGGLIARTAMAAGADLAMGWVDLITDVVTVGTPHLGTDLARLAAGGTVALTAFEETAALGRLLDRRSAGIKDLEAGLPELEPTPRVRYRTVSGEVSRPWGLFFGDLLVRRSSATGRTQEPGLFPAAEHLHLRSTGHLGLVRHPALPSRLQDWLR